MAWGSEASTRAAQVFPLLGPDYPLESAAAAVASALLTETFGFASGLVGYARRDLVDWAVAREILAVALPGALVGAALFSPIFMLVSRCSAPTIRWSRPPRPWRPRC